MDLPASGGPNGDGAGSVDEAPVAVSTGSNSRVPVDPDRTTRNVTGSGAGTQRREMRARDGQP